MKVFTYYVPIPGKQEPEELALIDLWKESWMARGWEAVVLSEADLPGDADSRRLMKAFRRQPTVMKPGLALSWYARWLAVAAQGGGFMSDYDVINYTLDPRPFGPLTAHERHVPCLMSGSRDEFLRMCEIFASYRSDAKDRVGWRKDTSDMKIMLRCRGQYLETKDCVEFSRDGWETAAAVHFSNFAMRPRNCMPRHVHIPLLRPLQ